MDRRTARTEQSIRDAFFDLLKERPIKEIRVVDICKRADINRSSFYTHYEDLPSFLRSIKKEIREKILDAFEMYSFDTNTDTMLTATLRNIRENKYLFSLMFEYDETDIWEACKQKMDEKTAPIWQAESGLPENEVRILLEYLHAGCYRLMELWYKQDFDVEDARFQELFENVVKYGVYHYIYHDREKV